MKLTEFYKTFSAEGESGENVRTLMSQTHWFTVNAEFDPKTGEALPQSLSTLLAKVAQPATNIGVHRDRLWRITEHSRTSVERLFRALNESPRREQALLPIYAVRELDANSFIKLSNRPGRNIREKLAGKPYLQAVRRFQSVNLPENRLLKAFVTRLAELLELRLDCLGEKDEDLLPKIQSWLLSDEAQGIARWDNLPPNNTLLSHRDYRRVWDAWRWLQTLDDDIGQDFTQLEARGKTMRLWKQCAQIWADGKYLFAEIPLLFDYEKFVILPWSSQPPQFKKSQHSIYRQFKKEVISEPACLDFTNLRPSYASKATSKSLRETYIWQEWKRDGESVDIELFNADVAYLHSDATSITLSDLFFSKDNTSQHLDRAARSFSYKLREVFKSDTLIWLVPDSLNDFELEVARRNLNARFPNAEPLPRSVAAAFEQVDYSIIKCDGFPIAIVDSFGEKTCVTKLLARFDSELRKRLPETRGYYWERCPPVIFAGADTETPENKGYDLITFDGHGQWCDATRSAKPQFIDSSLLMRDSRIGKFEVRIDLAESPVVGGIRLHSLKQLAGDIPLWRDRIPELSIKVMKDGSYQRFHLVSRGTTVKPIRGQAVQIPVDEDFVLPSGRAFYQFPIFQGENADDLGFSARLDSPVFPLKETVVCKLKLTFEYGADEPYKLVFIPIEKYFPHVRATWKKTEEVIITDAPSPEYPMPMTWTELCKVPKQNSNETSDLLEWVQSAIASLNNNLRPKKRTVGVISSDWRINTIGKYSTLVNCNETTQSVFIHEKHFVSGLDYKIFNTNDKISFELHEVNGNFSGLKVAKPEYKEIFDDAATRKMIAEIHKRLYFPVIQIWRDGRSLNDKSCPNEFADSMRTNIGFLASLLNQNKIPRPIENELLFLFSCMNKDAPNECIQWITKHVENGNIRAAQTVGFALGDVSEQWQKDMLLKLVTHTTVDSLRVFSYAIWREPQFFDKFNFEKLQSILKCLIAMLGEIRLCPPRRNEKDKNTVRNWVRATAEPLELLLGLLRTRISLDPKIKMLLQPHQKITKELVNQVERVTEIVAQSNATLFSRVQINIRKPEGDRTPDLLYALRLYLTGDVGANAIHITSVSDSDND